MNFYLCSATTTGPLKEKEWSYINQKQ